MRLRLRANAIGVQKGWKIQRETGNQTEKYVKQRIGWEDFEIDSGYIYIYIYGAASPTPPPLWMGHGPPPLWLWGCGGALLVSDAADFLWFLVPPPPPHGPPPCRGRFASIWRMALCACVCVCRVCVFVVFCSTG